MVFGRKKKAKSAQNKETKKTERKNSNSRKVPRRASYVSTPIRSKKLSRNKKSFSKNSCNKKKLCGPLAKSHQRETRQAIQQNGQEKMRERLHHEMQPQQQQKQQNRRQGTSNPPQQHPPPPPPPAPPVLYSQINSKQRLAAQPITNGRKGQPRNQVTYEFPVHSPPSVVDIEPRNRTAADIRRWLQWRMGVNEQLVSYVMSDGQDMQHSPPPMTNFPKDFTADTIDAILHHAFYKEKPRSSLDRLSYMIYGLPRVKLSIQSSPDNSFTERCDVLDSSFCRPDYDDNESSQPPPFHNESFVAVSRCSSHTSGGRLPRRQIKGNLFIQTNPPSNIPRYLPEPIHRNSLNTSSSEENGQDGNRVSRSSSRSYRTYYPHPHSPLSIHSKPPVAGAVPTLLSGLQPYDMACLRHVTRDRKL